MNYFDFLLFFPPWKKQSFMAPRYPSGPRGPGVRMPQGIGNEFNGVSLYRPAVNLSYELN